MKSPFGVAVSFAGVVPCSTVVLQCVVLWNVGPCALTFLLFVFALRTGRDGVVQRVFHAWP